MLGSLFHSRSCCQLRDTFHCLLSSPRKLNTCRGISARYKTREYLIYELVIVRVHEIITNNMLGNIIILLSVTFRNGTFPHIYRGNQIYHTNYCMMKNSRERKIYPRSNSGIAKRQPDTRKTPPLIWPKVPKKIALCTTGPINDTKD